jgi:heme/copper-type cytochrome/quinol oxidase subunit 2
MELIITIISFIYLLLIISPALIILMDFDINILPSFIVNSIGYQWAWSFSLYFLYFISYCDHYMISSIITNLITSQFFMFDISYYAIFPIWSSIKIFVISFDVIHAIGIYSLGIKIDAIPGRSNLASTLRSLFKGEHRGYCLELCGQSHAVMLIVGLSLLS